MEYRGSAWKHMVNTEACTGSARNFQPSGLGGVHIRRSRVRVQVNHRLIVEFSAVCSRCVMSHSMSVANKAPLCLEEYLLPRRIKSRGHSMDSAKEKAMNRGLKSFDLIALEASQKADWEGS